MTDSHAIAVPWFGGFIAFDSNEPGRDIESVLDALESHSVVWTLNRPGGNIVELLGPGLVELDDGHRHIGFMVLRTPRKAIGPAFILWIGKPEEADAFVRNARKRAMVDGYRLVERPYRYGGNSEDN
jgi:hypothetical protein